MEKEKKFFGDDEARFLDLRDNSKVILFIIVDCLVYQRWTKDGELIYGETLIQTQNINDLDRMFEMEVRSLEDNPNYVRLA
jgi:hypothetical protein